MKRTRLIAIGGLAVAGVLFGSTVPGVARSKGAAGMSAPDQVEARITELHGELHITPAQETQWGQVAQMMRDNGKTMADLRAKQEADAKALGAVDELKNYAAVIDAHADGVHKLIPAFQSLYDAMSDAQKKTADTVFRARVTAATKKHT